MGTEFSDRQQRELDYHREHARLHQAVLDKPFSWDVLDRPGRRWWNAYWAMYEYLLSCNLDRKCALVVGCGFGDDALRLAKLGATVSAFDLSPHSLEIARGLAVREGLAVDFKEMPAEAMRYEDNSFDIVVVRDILHHVEIGKTMNEIVRVARPHALLVLNEIYSHSITEKIRRSRFVERHIYPRMQKLIYGPGKPYITEDERKLNEADLAQILAPLEKPHHVKHFNFLVTRLFPDHFHGLARADRLILRMLRPIGGILAGRVLLCARVRKS